jgi:hypothetical protein
LIASAVDVVEELTTRHDRQDSVDFVEDAPVLIDKVRLIQLGHPN